MKIDLVSLQVFLYEHPHVTDKQATLKYKDTPCDNCPHYRVLTSPKMQRFVDWIRNNDKPHPCHKDDGCYCVGHVTEITARNNNNVHLELINVRDTSSPA